MPLRNRELQNRAEYRVFNGRLHMYALSDGSGAVAMPVGLQALGLLSAITFITA